MAILCSSHSFFIFVLFFMVSNSVSASYVFNSLLPNDVETRKIAPSRPFSPSNNSAEVPGDGRCLFRSVAHGACLRSGHPSPSHAKQKQLADDLRAKVVDEFIKRRADTEWFLEGDFDAYTGQMRKPHIWGGEPELLMSSHVLQMPITVVMEDKKSGHLKIIAEYGQEYGKDCPIQVIYHGYGHYDVLSTSPTSAYSQPYR